MSNRQGSGRPFQAGNQYGKGRPPGSRNKATIAMEALLDGEGEEIVRKTIDLAKAGDQTALRLCMDRLISPRRERTVRLQLPADLTTIQGISDAMAAVLKGAAEGEITPGEAVQFSMVLEANRAAADTQAIENRLAELERRVEIVKQRGPDEPTSPTT